MAGHRPLWTSDFFLLLIHPLISSGTPLVPSLTKKKNRVRLPSNDEWLLKTRQQSLEVWQLRFWRQRMLAACQPSAWPACDCSECTHLTLWTSLFPLHSGNGHSASLSVSGAGGLHSVLVIINYCLFVWSLHTQCLGSGTWFHQSSQIG